MARNDPQVNLRFPADLKDRLDVAAQQNKRSLTAEIVTRLEESFEKQLDATKLVAMSYASAEDGLVRDWSARSATRALESQVALLRHVLHRVVETRGEMPVDLKVLVDLLGRREPMDGNSPQLQRELLVRALVDTVEDDALQDAVISFDALEERAQRAKDAFEAETILLRKRYSGLLDYADRKGDE